MEKELNYYYQTNWETTDDHNDPFESALSSMVSSPTGGGSNGGDHGMMMELIGRLGCITESTTELSCIATIGNNSTNTSCYSTPLNSPPKASRSPGGVNLPNYPPGLLPINADPGFVERAAKFSSFGLNNNGCVGSGVNLEYGKLSRVSSNQSMMRGGDGKFEEVSRGLTPENGDFGDSREGSSVSEQNHGGQIGVFDGNSRKRKSFLKSKAKDIDNKVEQENGKSNAKRSKANDEEGKKQNGGECNTNNSNSNNNNNDKQNDSKEGAKAEPPKDYIHVRARRGQATDSHSLAERVRREKISERMKFLQDLVPGCNKVTGKATVLDEIINYVQSLQHQVEFLSMKLATFDPTTEFNPGSLLSKDMFQSKGLSTMPQIIYQLEQNSAQAFPHGYQPFQQLLSPLANIVPNGNENPFSSNPSNVAGIRQNPAVQLPPIAGFGDAVTQMPNFWEDDLQSIVQMGIVQNQTQSVHGTSPNVQMKVEQ